MTSRAAVQILPTASSLPADSSRRVSFQGAGRFFGATGRGVPPPPPPVVIYRQQPSDDTRELEFQAENIIRSLDAVQCSVSRQPPAAAEVPEARVSVLDGLVGSLNRSVPKMRRNELRSATASSTLPMPPGGHRSRMLDDDRLRSSERADVDKLSREANVDELESLTDRLGELRQQSDERDSIVYYSNGPSGAVPELLISGTQTTHPESEVINDTVDGRLRNSSHQHIIRLCLQGVEKQPSMVSPASKRHFSHHRYGVNDKGVEEMCSKCDDIDNRLHDTNTTSIEAKTRTVYRDNPGFDDRPTGRRRLERSDSDNATSRNRVRSRSPESSGAWPMRRVREYSRSPSPPPPPVPPNTERFGSLSPEPSDRRFGSCMFLLDANRSPERSDSFLRHRKSRSTDRFVEEDDTGYRKRCHTSHQSQQPRVPAGRLPPLEDNVIRLSVEGKSRERERNTPTRNASLDSQTRLYDNQRNAADNRRHRRDYTRRESQSPDIKGGCKRPFIDNQGRKVYYKVINSPRTGDYHRKRSYEVEDSSLTRKARGSSSETRRSSSEYERNYGDRPRDSSFPRRALRRHSYEAFNDRADSMERERKQSTHVTRSHSTEHDDWTRTGRPRNSPYERQPEMSSNTKGGTRRYCETFQSVLDPDGNCTCPAKSKHLEVTRGNPSRRRSYELNPDPPANNFQPSSRCHRDIYAKPVRQESKYSQCNIPYEGRDRHQFMKQRDADVGHSKPAGDYSISDDRYAEMKKRRLDQDEQEEMAGNAHTNRVSSYQRIASVDNAPLPRVVDKRRPETISKDRKDDEEPKGKGKYDVPSSRNHQTPLVSVTVRKMNNPDILEESGVRRRIPLQSENIKLIHNRLQPEEEYYAKPRRRADVQKYSEYNRPMRLQPSHSYIIHDHRDSPETEIGELVTSDPQPSSREDLATSSFRRSKQILHQDHDNEHRGEDVDGDPLLVEVSHLQPEAAYVDRRRSQLDHEASTSGSTSAPLEMMPRHRKTELAPRSRDNETVYKNSRQQKTGVGFVAQFLEREQMLQSERRDGFRNPEEMIFLAQERQQSFPSSWASRLVDPLNDTDESVLEDHAFRRQRTEYNNNVRTSKFGDSKFVDEEVDGVFVKASVTDRFEKTADKTEPRKRRGWLTAVLRMFGSRLRDSRLSGRQKMAVSASSARHGYQHRGLSPEDTSACGRGNLTSGRPTCHRYSVQDHEEEVFRKRQGVFRSASNASAGRLCRSNHKERCDSHMSSDSTTSGVQSDTESVNMHPIRRASDPVGRQVFLHATTVADIPLPEEDCCKSRLQRTTSQCKPSPKVRRSFSLLGLFRSRRPKDQVVSRSVYKTLDRPRRELVLQPLPRRESSRIYYDARQKRTLRQNSMPEFEPERVVINGRSSSMPNESDQIDWLRRVEMYPA